MTNDFGTIILCELQSTDMKFLSAKYQPSYRDYITLSLYHFLTQFAVFNVVFLFRVWDNSILSPKKSNGFAVAFLHGCDSLGKIELL
ncbi:MAG: hypothetical protein E6892_07320, partial [Streptococcus mitis]|nr:hypothetical protein [Streptococcus mitis]